MIQIRNRKSNANFGNVVVAYCFGIILTTLMYEYIPEVANSYWSWIPLLAVYFILFMGSTEPI